MEAYLILEDGTVFTGKNFGSTETVICELVFNTGLTGYLELLTDASNYGRGIVMTTPIIGNYGVFTEQAQGVKLFAQALIVRDLTHMVHDPRAAEDLDLFLQEQNLPGIYAIDTRALTLKLREKGYLRAMLTTDKNYDLTVALQKIKTYIIDKPIAAVSVTEEITYPAGAEGRRLSYLNETASAQSKQARVLPSEVMQIRGYDLDPSVRTNFRVAALDLGIKQNIIWNLTKKGCAVTVYPWNTDPEILQEKAYDGILLAGGPGKPQDCQAIFPHIRSLFEEDMPIMAINLGHLVLAEALGASTIQLKSAHRGINHPVRDHNGEHVYITAQNHDYVVDEKTLPATLMEVGQRHLNDDSIERLNYQKGRVISVQYQPEGAPGPLDSQYLFTDFVNLMSDALG